MRIPPGPGAKSVVCSKIRNSNARAVPRETNSLQLFAFLTHEDSKINIEVANASKALAEAAQRDGSSMKTIAVLTMVFLPARFLAALFSMLSLGWNQPENFSVYWAFAIPITVGTFALWAGVTQREQISGLLGRVRLKKTFEKPGRRSRSRTGEHSD